VQTELESFLIEITAAIFKKKDEMGEGYLIDKVQDKTGMKVGEPGGLRG
jgi:6-phosphogluconate dehydrogenase